MYVAVDLALVVDVLPGQDSAAGQISACSTSPRAALFDPLQAIAPTILAAGGDSYGTLYMVAGLCAIIGAAAILPVRRVR